MDRSAVPKSASSEKVGTSVEKVGADEKKDDVPQTIIETVPFQEFQQVLTFLVSIGLATAAGSAFGLVGITSVFGDSSAETINAVRDAALDLAWASVNFAVALALIVTSQLLYTDRTLGALIQCRTGTGPERLMRAFVGLSAWSSLGFQLAGMYFWSESLKLFAPKARLYARYGITAAVIVVGTVSAIGILSQQATREKLLYSASLGMYKPKTKRDQLRDSS